MNAKFPVAKDGNLINGPTVRGLSWLTLC